MFKNNHSLSGVSGRGSNQYDQKFGETVLQGRLKECLTTWIS